MNCMPYKPGAALNQPVHPRSLVLSYLVCYGHHVILRDFNVDSEATDQIKTKPKAGLTLCRLLMAFDPLSHD
ncbi:hypothetical protein DPMN_146797 [Dreissena polymorpha]|uniref:Uncharacterized protein n=1 Tax=Dreissena polymorpha TaxID=45954 RepID=A0A9D4FAZ5_DREPO|nr:hypothetical protein DPMN_146797 [Dreissena polymorpha]